MSIAEANLQEEMTPDTALLTQLAGTKRSRLSPGGRPPFFSV